MTVDCLWLIPRSLDAYLLIALLIAYLFCSLQENLSNYCFSSGLCHFYFHSICKHNRLEINNSLKTKPMLKIILLLLE